MSSESDIEAIEPEVEVQTGNDKSEGIEINKLEFIVSEVELQTEKEKFEDVVDLAEDTNDSIIQTYGVN